MCLGLYGEVVGFSDDREMLAHVDVEGVVRDINLAIVADDGVKVGDWLMIHMGVATEVLDAGEAERARQSLDMMGPGGQQPGWDWSP